jgi:4-amino-4-deoxy-L-arabinose transferase-like glycosyltransferase
VARERGAARGIAAAAALCASPAFVSWGVAQQADVPLAFLLLMTFVAIARGVEPGASIRWWTAAGLSAALAAWTKNEGLPFLAVVAGVVIGWRLLDRRRAIPRGAIAAFAAGVAPPLAALLIFKLAVLTTSNDLASQPWPEVWRLARQPARWSEIAGAISGELWRGGAATIGVLPIAAGFAIATGIDVRGRGAAAAALIAMAAMLAIYAAVYATTPHDLTWHLRTSAGRLVMHTLPATLWALFVLARRE